MPSEFSLRGMAGVSAMLGRLERPNLLRAGGKALEGSLQSIRAQAQALCPKKSGALAKSLRAQVQTQDGQALGTVSSALPYAARVEMGASDRPAQPFLYPAYKAAESGMAKRVMEAMLGGEEA